MFCVINKSRLLGFLTLSSAALLGFQVSAYAETLEQAVVKALQNNPKVAVAEAGVESAKVEREEKFSKYLPDLNVSTSVGRIYGENSTSRGSSTTRGDAYSGYGEGNVSAKQMLFDGFETHYRIKAAEAKKKAAVLKVLDVEESLALETVQAYIDLARAKGALKILRAHEAKVDDYLERIKTLVDEGATDEAEYQQARNVRIVLEGFVAEYEGQVLQAEATYMKLTGGLPVSELLFPIPNGDLMIEDVDVAVEYALSSLPVLEASKMQAVSLMRESDAETAVLYPDLNTELSWLKYDKKEVLGGELTDAKALLRLSWKYEVGGAQQARIEQKRVKYKEAMSKLHELERKAEYSVRQAYAEYQTSLLTFGNLEKRTEMNEKLFETYKAQFEGARISLLQLMQSNNQLFTARLERFNARARVLTAAYATLASLGRLRESLDLEVEVSMNDSIAQ